jgi:hypothetical protein
MAMDKKLRPERGGSQVVSPSVSPKAKADSRPIGKGGESSGVYINERGEVCYGDNCVTLAIDTQRHEVRVNIKQGGTCDVSDLVESLRQTLGDGARTVYEIESVIRDKPKD